MASPARCRSLLLRVPGDDEDRMGAMVTLVLPMVSSVLHLSRP